MNKVIGGEFKIEFFEKLSSIDNKKSYYSSGRSALFSVLKQTTIHKWGGVLLPDYLCSSIAQTCIDINIPYKFYHINEDLLPDEIDLFEKINSNCLILLISYFGLVSVEKIAEKIKARNPNISIVVDDVQNFYSSNDLTYCDFRFNSYRKWFAVPNGAEVFCKNKIITTAEKENDFAQYKFSGNLLKNYSEWVNDNLCLELLDKGEKILDVDYNCKCSDISRTLIANIKFEEIKEKRLENSAYLHKQLKEMGVNHIYTESSVPLFMPIFVNNRVEIRKAMFANKIFTPIHWPYESPELNGHVKNKIYDIELSLICDQRYSIEDMESQIRVLKECM